MGLLSQKHDVENIEQNGTNELYIESITVDPGIQLSKLGPLGIGTQKRWWRYGRMCSWIAGCSEKLAN